MNTIWNCKKILFTIIIYFQRFNLLLLENLFSHLWGIKWPVAEAMCILFTISSHTINNSELAKLARISENNLKRFENRNHYALF